MTTARIYDFRHHRLLAVTTVPGWPGTKDARIDVDGNALNIIEVIWRSELQVFDIYVGDPSL